MRENLASIPGAATISAHTEQTTVLLKHFARLTVELEVRNHFERTSNRLSGRTYRESLYNIETSKRKRIVSFPRCLRVLLALNFARN
jgi:hypothetical protein